MQSEMANSAVGKPENESSVVTAVVSSSSPSPPPSSAALASVNSSMSSPAPHHHHHHHHQQLQQQHGSYYSTNSEYPAFYVNNPSNYPPSYQFNSNSRFYSPPTSMSALSSTVGASQEPVAKMYSSSPNNTAISAYEFYQQNTSGSTGVKIPTVPSQSSSTSCSPQSSSSSSSASSSSSSSNFGNISYQYFLTINKIYLINYICLLFRIKFALWSIICESIRTDRNSY